MAKAEKERKDYYDSLPKVIVSKSAPQKRVVRILPRGNWMDESGEVVHAALPHFLPQPKIEGREPTRLDLAELARLAAKPAHGTCRHESIVAAVLRRRPEPGASTISVAQGEPPRNPALLDWLACEFMDSGWDMKHMVRTIVTSQTYRQSSTTLARTRRGRSRQPRARAAELLSASMPNWSATTPFPFPACCRRRSADQACRPYQPAKYWDNLNFPPRDYVADQGESEYRRGLYTWRQRTFPHPSLIAFDASSREACTAERTRSNIPQQALVLLNDPTYVEAARVFAARILSECHGTTEERITWAWQQSLQRNPSADELHTMQDLLKSRLGEYHANAASADALLKTGIAPVPPSIDKAELAAWTHIARVLLNLHETITRS